MTVLNALSRRLFAIEKVGVGGNYAEADAEWASMSPMRKTKYQNVAKAMIKADPATYPEDAEPANVVYEGAPLA